MMSVLSAASINNHPETMTKKIQAAELLTHACISYHVVMHELACQQQQVGGVVYLR